MVSPNAGPGKEDKLLHPDDHLIWCSKVDSGPRSGAGVVSRVGGLNGVTEAGGTDGMEWFESTEQGHQWSSFS